MNEKTAEQLRAELEAAQQAVSVARAALDSRLSETLVRCEQYGKGCKQAFEVRELEYIQTKWYTPPHGCTGGDYWNNGEGQWKCPTCGTVNRLHNKPDIEALRHLFKSEVAEYER